MSPELIFLACVIGLAAIILIVIKFVRIVPKCPQCKKIAEIYDSSVSEAWLDCQCLNCGYKWRIK